ncbi:hypothetical protein S225a_00450 [Candidatus Brocadiaceae bacterium S225]|uniref:Uncharacterized protein n=1 Tax=Candidatus Scalindua brodae TaxID=237368 RepID=A0A0B0EMB0_9BACT|nr:MAG: hypothetical protein SCABRO_01070 [Candidatus Scalindua brodae]TWU37999.1 hypothetical protein S225a_00450 [Candidatus Brocadiaceae bacterium S225]
MMITQIADVFLNRLSVKATIVYVFGVFDIMSLFLFCMKEI